MRSIASPRRLLATLVLALLAGSLPGCGGSGASSTGVDPAAVVPASTPLYAAAMVRPTGTLASDALSAGRALSHQTNPYPRLVGLLQTPGSPALSFKRDLASWLGARAGIFLSSPSGAGAATSARTATDRLLSVLQRVLLPSSSSEAAFPFASGGADGAIVLDCTDTGKARSFLAQQAARAGAHATSYRGVAYEAASGGAAFGVVDRFAVIGSEAALKGVIDTSAGSPALARGASYSRLLAVGPREALAHVYINGEALHGAATPQAGSSAGLLGLLVGARTANLSLLPSKTTIAIDADTLASGSPAQSAGLLTGEGEAARVVGELPGDSFLAIGFGTGGSSLAQFAQALHAITATGGGASNSTLSVKGLLEGLTAPLDAMTANTPEARRDFQSWMGPGAAFAGGTSLVDLKAGLVISSKNPALSRAAVSKLAVRLRAAGGSVRATSIAGTDAAVTATLGGLPLPLQIVDGRDANGHTKFVIALGEASVGAALTPPNTLLAAPSYSAAASALGERIQPSEIVAVPTVLGLLEGAGLSEDPTIAPVLAYVRPFAAVAGGGRDLQPRNLEPGIRRSRLVLGLRQGA